MMKFERKKAITQIHKQNIVEAAEQLFLDKGMKKTTMDNIAKVADCSKSTIYVYFKNKDEIYHTICFNGMLILKEGIKNVIFSDGSIFERYYMICNTLVDFQERYPFHFESMLSEIRVDEEIIESDSILRDIFFLGEEINNMIVNWIEDGIEEGILREDIKPYQTVFVFWSSISGVIKMVEQKGRYFEKTLQISKMEFLKYSFEMLLKSILK